VVVFEKESLPGGRVATETHGPYTFDTGAQSIVPRTSELSHMMLEELDKTDLIKIELPVFIHEHLRVTSGDPALAKEPRYTYRQGNVQLAQLLAEGTNVRYSETIGQVTGAGESFTVNGEVFDALIATMPAPQANLLQWGLGVNKPTAQIQYRPCASVLLGFDRPPPPTRYHALLNVAESHPLQWLSIENVKCPGRAPDGHTGFVAQLSGPFTRTTWNWAPDLIVNQVIGYLSTLYGTGWTEPSVSHVQRWKYSQPESIALFDSVNRPGDRLVLAGDGFAGGRIEYAFSTGLKAARMLQEML
jgi:hypothetical protein